MKKKKKTVDHPRWGLGAIVEKIAGEAVEAFFSECTVIVEAGGLQFFSENYELSEPIVVAWSDVLLGSDDTARALTAIEVWLHAEKRELGIDDESTVASPSQ